MSENQLPWLIVITGGTGTGKTTLAKYLAEYLFAHGCPAVAMSHGKWFRAFTALALTQPSLLTGPELVKLANTQPLYPDVNGCIVYGSMLLETPTDDDMRRLMPRYGGDPDLREFIIGQNIKLMNANPGITYIIEGRSPRTDYHAVNRRMVSLYLETLPGVAARLTRRTPDEVVARDAIDRQLPNGPLTDPESGDHRWETTPDNLGAYIPWATQLLRQLGVY